MVLKTNKDILSRKLIKTITEFTLNGNKLEITTVLPRQDWLRLLNLSLLLRTRRWALTGQ